MIIKFPPKLIVNQHILIIALQLSLLLFRKPFTPTNLRLQLTSLVINWWQSHHPSIPLFRIVALLTESILACSWYTIVVIVIIIFVIPLLDRIFPSPIINIIYLLIVIVAQLLIMNRIKWTVVSFISYGI